jgi:putative transposase
MDSGQHTRRVPTRLKNFDYTSSGAYFITICTHERRLLFAAIDDGFVTPTKIGSIVTDCWSAIPNHFPDVGLDSFVLMPNHLHGIIVLSKSAVGNRRQPGPLQSQPWSPSGSLGTIVRSFKSAVTNIVNKERLTAASPIWQRNYYEHVIRKDEDMNRIRQYIIENPKNWPSDRENPNSL